MTFFVVCFALGVVNVLLTTPLWVVNTRLKLQGAKFRNEDIVPTNYKGIIGKHLLLSSTKGKFINRNISRTLKFEDFCSHSQLHTGISVLPCHFAVIEFYRKLGLAISDGNSEFVVCPPASKTPFAKASILSYKFWSSSETSEVVAGSLSLDRESANWNVTHLNLLISHMFRLSSF